MPGRAKTPAPQETGTQTAQNAPLVPGISALQRPELLPARPKAPSVVRNMPRRGTKIPRQTKGVLRGAKARPAAAWKSACAPR